MAITMRMRLAKTALTGLLMAKEGIRAPLFELRQMAKPDLFASLAGVGIGFAEVHSSKIREPSAAN